MSVDPSVFVQLLTGALSPNNEERQQSEARIREAESFQEFGSLAMQVALAESVPVPVRQLAAIVLKQYVQRHWSSSAKKFVNPEVDGGIKSVIKASIVPGLGLPDAKMRTAFAMSVAAIADFDWPDSWPDLFPSLIHFIESQDMDKIHGAVICTEMFCGNITDDQIVHVVPVLLPRLLPIVSSPDVFPDAVRGAAMSIFRSLSELVGLLLVRKESVETVRSTLLPFLIPWLEIAVASIKVPCNPDQNCYYLAQVFATLKTVLHSLTKLFDSEQMKSLLSAVWRFFIDNSSQYQHVEGLGDNSSRQDRFISYPVMLTGAFDLLSSILRTKQAARELNETFASLVPCLMTYLRIALEQEESWESDPDQFVQDEDSDSFSFSVRIAAQEFLIDALVLFAGRAGCKVVLAAIGESVSAADTLKRGGDRNWWRVKEAALVALCCVVSADEDLEDELGFEDDAEGGDVDQPLFDSSSIARVLSQDMGPETPVFLRGRALWTLARISGSLAPEEAAPFVSFAIDSLNPTHHIAMRISGVRALFSFMEQELGGEVMDVNRASILRGLHSLIEGAGEEMLHLILYSMTRAIQGTRSSLGELRDLIVDDAVALWKANVEDPLLLVDLVDLVGALVKTADAMATVSNKLLAVIVPALATPQQMPDGFLETCFEMLGVITSGTTDYVLRPIIVYELLPRVIHVVTIMDDSSLTHSGSDFIRTLFRYRQESFLTPGPGQTVPPIEQVLEFTGYLLGDGVSEGAGSLVGNVLSGLFRLYTDSVRNILPSLIHHMSKVAVAATLTSTKLGMAAAWCQLVRSLGAEGMLNILLSCPDVASDKAGVVSTASLVLGLIVDSLDDSIDPYSSKLSVFALSTLLLSGDSRLESVLVPGPVIHEPHTTSRVTRSMARSSEGPSVGVRHKMPVVERSLTMLANTYSSVALPKPSGRSRGDSDSDVEYAAFDSGLMIDMNAFDDRDEEAPPDDPLNDTDLKGILRSFFLKFRQQFGDAAVAMFSRLPPRERDAVGQAFA